MKMIMSYNADVNWRGWMISKNEEFVKDLPDVERYEG